MHYHILGIAGTMTTPIAVDLLKHGHTVTGSDQEKIYPPISDTIEKYHLQIGWNLKDNIEHCQQSNEILIRQLLSQLRNIIMAENVSGENLLP